MTNDFALAILYFLLYPNPPFALRHAMSRKHKNPLDLPEIRQRVGLFLSVKDAISCARVCRDWREDFVSAVWRFIDDAACRKLTRTQPAVVADILPKHGHRIRIIQTKSADDLGSRLQNASISRLKSLSIEMNANSRILAHCGDIIHRNIDTLSRIELSLPLVTPSELLFNVDVLSPHAHSGSTSRLAHLKLHGVRMTRNSFSRLLRICPALETLDICRTVVESSVITDNHQHRRLDRLIASIDQVFIPDASCKNAPSLLHHFPNLTQWETWQTSNAVRDTEAITKDIRHCCPMIHTVHAREGALSLPSLLFYGFKNLTEITFQPKQLSPRLVLAILTHKNTLKTVVTSVPNQSIFQSTIVPILQADLAEDNWDILFLPSQCVRLRKLSLPLHEVQIHDIENVQWMCEDLEVLHIRIKGLRTREQVERTLELWSSGKKSRSNDKNPSLPNHSQFMLASSSHQGTPIEARVAKHLLKFKKLQYVWLGTKVWRA
ncbi:hypothetical protein BGX34_005616 [Mortierella sp. NVP85]|nr:hypothetical protein BGX34_005616 [Mortierella sp. NVP85]